MWSSRNASSKAASKDRNALTNGRNGKTTTASRFTAIMQPTPLSSTSLSSPGKPNSLHPSISDPLIGPLPSSIHAEILSYLPVYDIPSVARVCKRLGRVVRCDHKVWRRRCGLLNLKVDEESLKDTMTPMSPPMSPRVSSSHRQSTSIHIPTLPKPSLSNRTTDHLASDFNNFTIDNEDDGFGGFENGHNGLAGNGKAPAPAAPQTSLLDLDFDLDSVPLPSKMMTGKGAKKPSGFFALAAPTPPPNLSNGSSLTHTKRQSLSFAQSSPNYNIANSPYYSAYKEYHLEWSPYVQILRATSSSGSNGTASVSPSQLLSLLFPQTAAGPVSLSAQAVTLAKLLRFLGKENQPTRDWGWLRQILGGCCDRFDAICLNAFDKAEGRLAPPIATIIKGNSNLRAPGLPEHGERSRSPAGDVERLLMREAAESSWVVHIAREEDREDGPQSRNRQKSWAGKGFGMGGMGAQDSWELGRVWVEKKGVFYEGSKWDPSENIVKISGPQAQFASHRLDFNPMDAFMGHLLAAIQADGDDAMRVFPSEAANSVMLAYAERLATDVLAEYINALLAQTRHLSQNLFLTASAATFIQAWRTVDAFCAVIDNAANETSARTSDKSTLRSEVGSVIFSMFEVNMDDYLDEEVEWIKESLNRICKAWEQTLAGTGELSKTVTAGTAFIASDNPDQVKRNVLAGFRDVLLLPVTIVPLTVNYGVHAITAGGKEVVNGLSMLNPQRWTNQSSAAKAANGQVAGEAAAQQAKLETGQTEVWVPPAVMESGASALMAPTDEPAAIWEGSGAVTEPSVEIPLEDAPPVIPAASTENKAKDAFDQLQLLLSLDIVLELIQVDRESLKRVETFRDYPGQQGKKVRETIEEVFILLLKALGNRHIAPGFRKAIAQMGTYEPGQDEDTTTSVAPLVQFFELVHIGDTIQSIVQTYFDKDLTLYVDKTDFLNAAVQEKKRFEATLDDSVAGGLNAGIEVLMNQVDHIIQTRTPPRAYCPPEGADMELGPTKGCQDAIKCLEQHCELLKGSTSKDVLEVFNQEVGIRLQAILQRHIKRQIISQIGGFQMISDLNAYHQFISSLKQQRLTDDFSNLKMLGHVYVVADAKDLASIVRDVTRYGGTFTPEDVYEFIQRRSDWRKISKTVDQAMYALSVKEDCVLM